MTWDEEIPTAMVITDADEARDGNPLRVDMTYKDQGRDLGSMLAQQQQQQQQGLREGDGRIVLATAMVNASETGEGGFEKPTDDDLEKEKSSTRRKRLFLWVFLGVLIVITAAVVGVVVATSSGSESSSNTANASQQNVTNDGDDKDDGGCPSPPSDEDSGNEDRFLQEKDFWSIGCFLRQASVDEHPLTTADGASVAEQAAACHKLCITRHFGVAENTCYCYVDSPQQRLTIGSCQTACGTPVSQRMEAYANLGGDSECNQQVTTSVRNFLVEENDAPFGFDLIQNTYRQSPFELFKEACGTNMYEVQTEVSHPQVIFLTRGANFFGRIIYSTRQIHLICTWSIRPRKTATACRLEWKM